MNRFIPLTIIALLSLPLQAVAERGVYFAFYPVISLAQGEGLTVGKVGRFIGRLPKALNEEHLLTLPLYIKDISPEQPLKGIKLERVKLEQAIQKQIHATDLPLAFSGQRMIRINPVVHYADGQRLIEKAQAFLTEQLAGDIQGLSLNYVGGRLPKVPKHAKLKFTQGPLLDYKRVCVWLDMEQTAAIPLWFSLRGYKEVYVSSVAAKAGDTVQDSAIKKVTLALEQLHGTPLHHREDANNKRFLVDVTAGRVITQELVQTIPAISAGDNITVESVYGVVKISGQAQALTEGNPGERVKLRSLSSQEEFYAYVQGHNKAVVGLKGITSASQ